VINRAAQHIVDVINGIRQSSIQAQSGGRNPTRLVTIVDIAQPVFTASDSISTLYMQQNLNTQQAKSCHHRAFLEIMKDMPTESKKATVNKDSAYGKPLFPRLTSSSNSTLPIRL
jgi:hypothetical protein